MLSLHLSDFHLSRYGESGRWHHRDQGQDGLWEPLQTWHRWQIEGKRDRRSRPQTIRLVDPEGVVHKVKAWPSRREERAISALLAIAMKRHRTSAERLVKSRPSHQDVQAMLREDPYNTNLRFLLLVDRVCAIGPEAILLTGDITDNGFGYGLVLHYFKPWIDKRRLLVVPGNHDTYDMMPRLGRRARTLAKQTRYAEFAAAVGMEFNEAGSYVRQLGDLAVVGLNSCSMPRTPLSASGAVSKHQLAWLRELGRDVGFRNARVRVALVHHHLLRIPFMVGRSSPIEVGMRLRNATEVVRTCTDAGMNALFNGHRHHGYVVQLPGRPMVISAPSSTLGCKSAVKQVYGWRINLSEASPLPTLEQLLEPPPKARAHP